MEEFGIEYKDTNSRLGSLSFGEGWGEEKYFKIK